MFQCLGNYTIWEMRLRRFAVGVHAKTVIYLLPRQVTEVCTKYELCLARHLMQCS